MSVADRTCRCGRPTSAGRINAGPYGKCLICQVAQDLAGVDLRPRGKPHRLFVGPCRRCQRQRPLVAFGLCGACDQAGRRARIARDV